MRKKYYAIKKGIKTGIVESWEACQQLVHGYPGAIFKSFNLLEDATKYLEDNLDELPSQELGDQDAIIYSDGGFNQQILRVGYGAIIFTKNNKYELFGSTTKWLDFQNVSGEILAITESLNFLINNHYKHITIYHDYSGLAKFASGEWKAKNAVTKWYQENLQKYSLVAKINFIHVKGHAGNFYNEEVDRLVRNSYDTEETIINVARNSQNNRPKAEPALIKEIISKNLNFTLPDPCSNVILITGRAGTGKSTLIKKLEADFTEHNINTCLGAPTGISAININGSTIHHLFHLKTGLLEVEEQKNTQNEEKIYAKMDVLILDEISMVRVDVMESINRKLQLALKNDSAFGGIVVILFGDLYQLPPIVNEREVIRYDNNVTIGVLQYLNETFGGIYFFNAPVLVETKIIAIELNQVYRQTDLNFIRILDHLRMGNILDSDLQELNKRRLIPKNSQILHLTTTNQSANLINNKALEQIKEESQCYEASFDGSFEEEPFKSLKELKLKVGAQVMLLKNTSKYQNGTIGEIVALAKNIITIKCADEILNIERTKWEKYEYRYNAQESRLIKVVQAVFEQFPLKLAWAITIHKSQAQSFEEVYLDLSSQTFTTGQAYVGLSRCRSLEGLYLKNNLRPQDIMVDANITNYLEKLKVQQCYYVMQGENK
ncbi:MAG: viroplasmin family protein [Acholeplasmatales bacterium]|jgi:viroplasmin and RNaseH domain-containing protein|nr:viroplasmin family protein [Acholeplasmatales bacterium]